MSNFDDSDDEIENVPLIKSSENFLEEFKNPPNPLPSEEQSRKDEYEKKKPIAKMYFENKNWSQAREDYYKQFNLIYFLRKEREWSAKLFIILSKLIECCSHLGKDDEIEIICEKTIELGKELKNKKLDKIYLKLAEIKEEKNELEEAMRILDDGISFSVNKDDELSQKHGELSLKFRLRDPKDNKSSSKEPENNNHITTSNTKDSDNQNENKESEQENIFLIEKAQYGYTFKIKFTVKDSFTKLGIPNISIDLLVFDDEDISDLLKKIQKNTKNKTFRFRMEFKGYTVPTSIKLNRIHKLDGSTIFLDDQKYYFKFKEISDNYLSYN